MNLFEISDEFATPKYNPDEDMKHLAVKEKRLRYELEYVRKIKDGLIAKITGNIKRPNWNEQQPDDPSQKENIQKVINSGYVPVYVHDHTSFVDTNKRLITMYVPELPQNEDIIKKLGRVCTREIKVNQLLRHIPTEIRKTKNRLSAWKRKQPTYVSRNTGKELLAEIKKKMETFLEEEKLGVHITNSYYWAKNKMIVVEISVRTPAPGMSVNQTAKQVIKPQVNKFLEDLGYSQFRFSERYIDLHLTILKIQIDDVEAKNKAISDETT